MISRNIGSYFCPALQVGARLGMGDEALADGWAHRWVGRFPAKCLCHGDTRERDRTNSKWLFGRCRGHRARALRENLTEPAF
jgi:hypothetical protein